MTKKTRGRIDAGLKAKIALEALRGHRYIKFEWSMPNGGS